MGLNLTEKILAAHLLEGSLADPPGHEIGIRIDQTLTQDATGTMAYLQFEAIGQPQVATELSVAYVDHNMLQTDFANADDHAYIASVAKKHGIWYSRPGAGVCHQVHLERFAKPGKTLIGSDSHTPTAGGMGCLAMGAGGLDVAVAMAGGPYFIARPAVLKVELSGELSPSVSAKDVILELLRRLRVKGGVGKVIEYAGLGVASLSVPERATITNMGAELGATSSIFPSDAQTQAYLEAQGRGDDWVPLAADADASYQEEMAIDLSALVPLAACPHSPDNVKPVAELAGLPVDQVCVGSCTNSSYVDLMRIAAILEGQTVAERTSLTVSPGSKQVLAMIARNGALATLIDAGARLLESGCGPCIGMGQAPASGAVSLRTFNRNFEGRSGTKDAQVYIVSPETAAASAIAGVFTDPTTLDKPLDVELPRFEVNDNMIVPPAAPAAAEQLQVVRGPNIKPFPQGQPLPDALTAPVLLKVGDDITTDHIMPAGAKVLPLRSNIPAMSDFCFLVVDRDFPARAKAAGQGFVVAGENYGQGSSREHAALVPLYLGVKAVIAKSFARIHKQNLVNNGILPLTFADPSDYDKISLGDELTLPDLRERVTEGKPIVLTDLASGAEFELLLDVSARNRRYLLAGGLLNTL
ncbi:MAG: aconitate hydratase [Propionibacteriaceae bacterium]|jgi:aconitate hydratase|nr:aconitate hydratase [Propionibacteriaceae bacterium]